jgi:hypothetical protein
MKLYTLFATPVHLVGTSEQPWHEICIAEDISATKRDFEIKIAEYNGYKVTRIVEIDTNELLEMPDFIGTITLSE